MVKTRGRHASKVVLALATAVALAGAACGSDDDASDSPATTVGDRPTDTTTGDLPTASTDDGSSDTSPSSEPESTDPGANAAFDPNGVITLPGDFTRAGWTDPNEDTGQTVPVGMYMGLIYGRLLTEGETAADTAPGLVTEWATPNDETVELTLQEGATFSDGTPFNAEAMKMSWERCAAKEGFQFDLFTAFESADVVDDTHLVVNLSRPVSGAWVDYLLKQTTYCMPIVSPTAVEEFGDAYPEHPTGAGPYMIESYEPEQKMVLVPNPHYHAPDEQTFARIEIIQTADGAPTVTALASGQADLAIITPAELEAVEQAGLTTEIVPSMNILHLMLCQAKAPFDNVDARRAVLHAIDPDAINSAAFNGQSVPNRQLTVPDFRDHSAAGEDEKTYDAELAQELADSSGLTGQTIDLMYFASLPTWGVAAQVIQAQLSEIGVTVNLIPTQNPFADQQAQQPHMNLWTFFPQSVPTSLLPDQINNTCNLNDPALNAPIERLWVADEAIAAEAWDELQTAVNETVPVIPLVQFPLGNVVAYNDRVAGDVLLPMINGRWGFDWSKIGIAEGS
jgi:peptide/nickel transport system substrate-binding protein